jgi:3D (Asp-Asp-Asp) domain-containing protein
MLGTKGKPQNSNLILGAALSVSILVSGSLTGYGVHKISNLEEEITKQHKVMESQGKKLEEQGVLTNQQKETIDILKEENFKLNELLKTKDSEIQVKEKEIDSLKEKQKEVSAMPSRGSSTDYKEYYVEATGYIAMCQEGCTGITATGYDLKAHPEAKVIAVDPDVIPLGSKVYVEGYGYAVALDTGGGIDDFEVDLHFPTTATAKDWGRKTVKIKVFN